MAPGGKNKKTLGQKAQKFFLKTTLCAAFAGAVAGTGYNYYGTKQDITAKITAVEPMPSAASNDTAERLVRTDQGVFVNKPTRMYFKDDAETAALDEQLVPGKTVTLTVYGIDPRLVPKIGAMSLEDFQLYRNILTVRDATPAAVPAPVPIEKISAAQVSKAPEEQVLQTLPLPAVPAVEIVQAPALAPVTAAAPAPGNTPAQNDTQPAAMPQAIAAVPQTTAPAPELPPPPPSAVVEDTLTPEACAPNADLAAITQKTPELSRDLDLMSRLPLTGRGIYDMLKNPANGITSCLYPVPLAGATESTFESMHARIGRGTGTSTAFHEYFHAWQDVSQGNNDMFTLSMKDALISNLLEESSAVAYEMASQREAENLKFPFEPSSTYVVKTDRGTTTYFTQSASTNPDNQAVFDAAYDAAWAQGAALEAQTREAKALEAGGQAVVRRLMDGQDADWKAAYTDLALENVNNNRKIFREDGTSPGYDDKRRGVFSSEGALSPQINFIPPEYLGPEAAQVVDKCFKGMGFDIAPVTPPPPPAPQAGKGFGAAQPG